MYYGMLLSCKKNKIMTFAKKINQTIKYYIKVTQTQKAKCHMFSLI